MTQEHANKGGRPPLPTPPLDAAECRHLIAQEVVRTNPRERTLRHLYRLLKSYIAVEDAARDDAKTRLKSAELALQKEKTKLMQAEYRRRFAATPLGARAMIRQIETLKSRIRELELEATSQQVIDCGVMQDKSEDRGTNA